MTSKPPSTSNREFFLRYASLGTQLMAALALMVFLGLKADRWLHTLPLFSILLPLLILVAMFWKLFRETDKSHTHEE